jgi:hypothetical protein
MPAPLRLLVHDRTCRGQPMLPGLSHAWGAGSALYRGLGRLDASFGAASWAEALDWLATVGAGAPIAEVQFWGHGKWGRALIDRDVLDERTLTPGHPDHARLLAVRERLLPGDQGLWWFRTCETFGAAAGHRFASAFTRFLGCRAAGHTYVIGFVQSGLHSLAPGATPAWSLDEGLPPGLASPDKALASAFTAPNTVTCLHGRIPPGY